MTWLVIYFAVCVVGYGIFAAIHDDHKKTAIKPKPAVKDRAEQFSFIGWQIVKGFEELPESNRPTSFDIEIAIKALDFKYNRDSVNAHFPYHMVKNGVNRINCDCITGRSNGVSYRNDRQRYDKCQKFSSYTDLYDEMIGIKKEIRRQEKALADQERAVQLAGMQGDLDSVDSIMAALKQEREALSGATTEIYKQTRSISD